MYHRPAFLPAAVLLISVAAAACGDESSMRMTPAGPGAGVGPVDTMGMSMAVGSEFDYLTRMIPHHEEAIATARILERGTLRQDVRSFAAAIVATQTAEVEQMRTWLAEWYPGRDTRVFYQPMMRDLTGLTGSALDRAFLEDMIPHHMMAIMMSQQLIARNLAAHPAVVPFAAGIRDTQRAEIQTMSAWLRE